MTTRNEPEIAPLNEGNREPRDGAPGKFWRVASQRVQAQLQLELPVRLARDQDCPLSSAQRRLWFIQTSEPDCTAYNLSFAWRVRGPFAVPALETSMNALVARHEVLRTTYSARAGDPVQRIERSRRIAVELIRLDDLPEAQQEAQVAAILQRESGRPFNLENDLPVRTVVVKLSDDAFIWQLVFHHIAFDGGSWGIFQRELEAVYNGIVSGTPVELTPPPWDYVDFAAWEHGQSNANRVASQLAHWMERLGGKQLPLTEIAPDYPRPKRVGYRGARIPFVCPPDAWATAQRLRKESGTTLFVVMLAAFEAVLARYTRQNDILIGTPISNRTSPYLDEVIGFFANTLPLHLSGDPDQRFAELIQKTHETVSFALANPDVPLETIVEELQPVRQPGRRPLFQIVFAYQNLPDSSPQLAGLNLEPIFRDNGTAKFDLALSVENEGHRLAGAWEFNTELYDRATIARLARNYVHLLTHMNGHQTMGELPLINSEERLRLSGELATSPRSAPRLRCVVSEFERQVALHPERIGLEGPGGPVTYAELNQRANRLAAYLRRRGVRPETRVAICLDRSSEMIVAILAVLKANGGYIPLDPSYPQARLISVLQAASAQFVITTTRFQQVLFKGADHPLNPRMSRSAAKPGIILLDVENQAIAQESSDNLRGEASELNLAYLIFTSGSTGVPKGVMTSRGNLAHSISARLAHYTDAPRKLLFVSSFAFDSSIASIFWPLVTGGTLCLMPAEVESDPATINGLIQHGQITHLVCLPSYYQLLLERARPAQLDSLTTVIVGGEISPKNLVERHYQGLPSAHLHNEYGPTEATVWSSVFALQRSQGESGNVLGRPIPNAAIYLLDARGELVPQGAPGEVHIAGPGLARGYCDNPGLTAERFIPHDLATAPGERLYRTGDWARWRFDGTLEFLGRIDQQVKVRGYRIELDEIESVIGRYPGLREVALAAQRDGQGQAYLAAYVAPWAEHPPKVSDLRSYLRQQLPDFMVPSAFVMLSSLPRSANGKLDRQALPPPVARLTEHKSGYLAPRTALEIQLVALWEKALGKRPIGVQDSFFDLGGHSFIALRLCGDVEKRFGRRLPLSTVVTAPTIEQMAKLLCGEGWTPNWSSLVPIKAGGNRPPFYCVHGIGGNVVEFYHLARHLAPDQPLYGLQAKGLDGRQEGHSRVEAMAAHYLHEIRDFQPEGPYYLGGSSFGGMVAYEMAQQLRATGQSVALLVLFDTDGPGYPRFLPTTTAFRKRWYFWRRRFELHWTNVRLAAPEDRTEYLREKARRLRKRLKHWARDVFQELFLPRSIKQVRRRGEDAARRYFPQPYQGRLTLFRATEQPYGIYEDRTLGWRDLAAGGLDIVDIPGHHGSIVREPRVRELARQLRLCLRENQ